MLVDTSVAVPIVLADHEHHRPTLDAVGRRSAGLSGHAAFETFSVLTRLPSPARRSAATVTQLLRENFPGTRFLSAAAASELLGRLPSLGTAGGSVYDALVGATAVEHGLRLLTRDRRAVTAYRALEVDVELLE
ncbi:MAG: type II toxin-antitoxin system VapC family toxin [Acidimicrobiales bacterium]